MYSPAEYVPFVVICCVVGPIAFEMVKYVLECKMNFQNALEEKRLRVLEVSIVVAFLPTFVMLFAIGMTVGLVFWCYQVTAKVISHAYVPEMAVAAGRGVSFVTVFFATILMVVLTIQLAVGVVVTAFKG